jgi:hypothetical protein
VTRFGAGHLREAMDGESFLHRCSGNFLALDGAEKY